MLYKRILPFFIALIALPLIMNAQVTTSIISGTIRAGNEGLSGATVVAVHTPSGTTYQTVTLKDGVFNLVNLIPGGPYKINISYVGFQTYTQDDVLLSLGENTRIDVTLLNSNTALQEVVITGTGNTKRKTGASTNISRQQIESLPTLNRSLADVWRLTPQATGTNSFGGVNNRYNNITIDGAVNNDVFGLSGSGTPGGQANTSPISLDAIQEVQVVLAPYDITYGNFTGAGVNAITRSGTNKFDGSAYYFLRNEKSVGKDPVTKVKTTEFTNKQYGVRIGGPIIPNKLFFFVNGDITRIVQPTLFNAGEQGSLLTLDEAKSLSDILKTKYQYDAGSYDRIPTLTQSDKLFGRIDWNISNKHRLTVRHNYIKAFDDNISRSPTLFRFGNNAYRINNKQNITVAELRSRFSNRVSNDLIVGLHRIRDFRTTNGQLFPFIEISKGSANNGIQIGSDRSSVANELDQNIFEITDNLKIFKGKHTFTIGSHNEFFNFRNLFINNFNGRWTFSNIAAFMADNPRQVQVTYSNIPGDLKPSAKFSAAQLGLYAQDEIQISPQFRLTAGLRVDMPIVRDEPAFNKVVDSTFKSQYSTSHIPNKQLLWSPRIGFNYDVVGDKSTIVRGGVGIFTGRVPFVWISNQFSNNGLLLNTISVSDDTRTPNNEVNNGKGFDPDPLKQGALGTAFKTFEVNIIDKNFKFPQVLRFNLATDVTMPDNFLLTLEGMYSKTINNIAYSDVNLAAPAGVVDPAYNNGADRRIAFSSSTSAGGRRINPNITNAILLSNLNKGYTYNFTAQLSKTWKHVFASFAYNHNGAADVNSGASSTALSNWEFVQVVGNPNNPQLAASNFGLTHRVSALLSVNFNFAKYFKTSVSLFYSGNSGSKYTYLVNGDLNSDGRFGNDLLYVPRNQSEIKFIDFLNSDNTIRFTAAQQAAAFDEFINNDPYLSNRRGMYTERNESHTPWENILDGRIAQQFYIKTGATRHTLEFTFDVFNLSNLLNNRWGRLYSVSNQAYNILTVLNRTSGPAASQGKGYNFTIGQTPWNVNFASRFQGQLGLRYSIN
ncbi:MAG: TonB-dependent receptor [Chitinophagaceae bacterium]